MKNIKEIQTFLESNPLFSLFEERSLHELLEHSAVETYSAGEKVVEFGRPGEIFGVVIQGTASVVAAHGGDAGEAIATLEPGDFFGEMSLLTGEPTTADVVAASTLVVLSIPQGDLSRQLPSNPKALQKMARTLTRRLMRRETNVQEQALVEGARKGARRTRSFRPVSKVDVHRILVLNLGSSSLKYDFFDSTRPKVVFRGVVEKIGHSPAGHRCLRSDKEMKTDVEAADHAAALDLVFDDLVDPESGVLCSLGELSAVGHRVVHGGEKYSTPVVIDEDVLDEIKSCVPLAPLHNPVNLLGIQRCREVLPRIPQIAVFDTAFHQTMPSHAYHYAVPEELYEKHKLRRYGFHGTSHKYVSLKAAAALERPSGSLKTITCHLGNGASVCAIDHGRVIDTSMGLTPLEGLVMGTRSGDVDPGLVLHLCRELNMTAAEVDTLLNKKSGLLGLSGVSNDMRKVVKAAESGQSRALLALRVFCYRIKKYIGSYVAALGGLDALVFTGGIGENSAWIRSRVCRGLRHMGITVHDEKNSLAHPSKGEVALISEPHGSVEVMVIPTDEEGMIARETVSALGRNKLTESVHPEEIPIPVGISAHHIHLQPDHVEALFGQGHTLTPRNDLAQPGQFACEERVDLVGPKGRVKKVRVLGPTRDHTQVEISRTEEFKLGIDAPIRASGDLEGSLGLTLEGPKGKVVLEEGVINALRHIHMPPEDALRLAVRDRDMVSVSIKGKRSLIFGDVLVRVKPSYVLEMHVDTDEANAAELSTGAVGFLHSIESRRP